MLINTYLAANFIAAISKLSPPNIWRFQAKFQDGFLSNFIRNKRAQIKTRLECNENPANAKIHSAQKSMCWKHNFVKWTQNISDIDRGTRDSLQSTHFIRIKKKWPQREETFKITTKNPQLAPEHLSEWWLRVAKSYLLTSLLFTQID